MGEASRIPTIKETQDSSFNASFYKFSFQKTLEEAKKDDIIVNSKIDGGTSKIPNKEIKKPTI